MTGLPWRSAALRLALLSGASGALACAGLARLDALDGVAGIAVLASVVATATFLGVRAFVGRPLDTLRRAIDGAADSRFLGRAATDNPDEFGELARACNRLLAKITDLHVSVIDSERELLMKQEIEDKARIIEAQNAELAQRLREQELLGELARTMSATLDLRTVLRIICERASKTLGYEEVAILLVDEATGQLQVRATHGFPGDAGIEGMMLSPGEGISGIVARTGEVLLIPDTSRDTRYLHYKGKHLVDGSFLCCPIKKQDRIIGLFNVLRPRIDGFKEGDIRIATSLASYAALAIANAQLHGRVADLSMTDELTQLSNRRLFHQRFELELDRSERYASPFGVLMIDIDHFKRFNDTFGHAKGDEALRKVAESLKKGLRRIDLVARFGGEEFVALLPREDKASARAVAEKLRKAASELVVEGCGSLSISVGVAAFPEDGRDEATLLEASDRALFAAKGAGRNRVVVYEPGMDRPGSRPPPA